MHIRERLGLIVIVSILLTAIPASIWVAYYSKEKILNREIKNLLIVTQNQADIASRRLSAGQPKLRGLARLLQQALKKPVTHAEIKDFYRTMTLDSDGVWRNRRAQYNGKIESGVFLPDSPKLTDKQKVMHLRIKRIMDDFGAAANRLHENVWFLSPYYRSEVIFDTTFPNFVFDQKADNDYTHTPWVTYTSPKLNPKRRYIFTPPLFDPVPKVWMVSALYPLYLGDKWIGSLGEDLQLTSVLGFMFRQQQLYPDTQHFLLDNKGDFILAGKWQKQLENGHKKNSLNLTGEQPLQALLKTSLSNTTPRLLTKKLKIDGKDYIAIGTLLEPVHWRYFRLVSVDDIVEPVQKLLWMLIVMVFVITAVCGALISSAIHSNVVSRLQRLTDAIRQYHTGDKKSLETEFKGNDEITRAAHEFDVMEQRIESYVSGIAEAREALAESEERWKFALEGAGDGLWDWDIKSGVIFYSPQWQRMLGYDDGEVENVVSGWQSLINPNDKDKALQQLQDYLVNQRVGFAAEYRMRCKDGSWKWILSRGMVIKRDKELKPLRMIGTHTDISRLKDIQNELHEYTQQLRSLLEYSPIAVRIAAQDGHRVVFANKRYAELINRDSDNAKGADPADFYARKSDYQTSLDEINSGLKVTNRLTELAIPVEGCKWVLASYLPIKYESEDCIIGWFYDITDRLRVEEALRLNASVFDNAWEGIMITDADNRVVSVNQAFTEITGYTQQDLEGKNPNVLASGLQSKDFYKNMWQNIIAHGRWRGEVWNRKKSGEFYAEILTVSAVKNEQNEVTHYVGIFANITEIKQTERILENMAHYDALTQLANRTLLSDRLERALVQAKRNKKLLAVCFIDLDEFKPINDEYGHDIGDKLLVEVAQRLSNIIRGEDTVARLGGDEFIILLSNIDHVDELDFIISRINGTIAKNIHLDGKFLNVSASIGVAVYPHDNSDADTLIRHADMAMYEAKQAGRNNYHIFDAKLDKQMHEHHLLIDGIEAALMQGEFCLYYQPKVNIVTHEVVGMEALIRWQHPDKGLLMPAEFLPPIETHELIVKLGDWVLEQALHQLLLWLEAGLELQVSVNVSARQIQHPDFIDKLDKLLALYPDISSSLLELEILETSALETYQTAQIVMNTGQQLGVSFALDDFGTGYSSLSYLKQLPAKTLKIDQSFIRGMVDNKEDRAIVNGIVELARVFKRKIVAEGVETQEHCEQLLAMDCYIAQGFGIARPMPAEEVMDWVAQYHRDAKKKSVKPD